MSGENLEIEETMCYKHTDYKIRTGHMPLPEGTQLIFSDMKSSKKLALADANINVKASRSSELTLRKLPSLLLRGTIARHAFNLNRFTTALEGMAMRK